jgi:endonuclease/exonuclease/phosphatase (EEP) superfamily protein YafD
MPEEPGRGAVPAYFVGVATVVVVVIVGLVAKSVDGATAIFTDGHLHVGIALGWLVCAGLTALVVTRHLRINGVVDEGPGLAVAYDALPMLLLLAWVVLIAALLASQWLLAGVAAALAMYHLVLVLPRMWATRTPRWAKHAPRLEIVVANVFIDNKTPDDAARQLVEAAVDVVIIVESMAPFMAIFDEVGGKDTYPFRVSDPDDDSDYSVTLASKRELGAGSRMEIVGPLRLAIAELDVEGAAMTIVALNPMATVDPGGHETWKDQIDELKKFVPTVTGPMVIAGDLNTTRYRPEFTELLDLGLTDAIDSLGKGLDTSFKLGSDGVLGDIGAVARLDHALVNDLVHAIAVEDLEACGSDHLPFKLTVAIRTEVGRRRQ